MQQIMLSSAFAPKTIEKMKTGEFRMNNTGEKGVELTPIEKEYESKL